MIIIHTFFLLKIVCIKLVMVLVDVYPGKELSP